MDRSIGHAFVSARTSVNRARARPSVEVCGHAVDKMRFVLFFWLFKGRDVMRSVLYAYTVLYTKRRVCSVVSDWRSGWTDGRLCALVVVCAFVSVF